MTESLKKVMCDLYRAELESQMSGIKDSPFVEMCVVAFRHGIEETLEKIEPKQKKLVELADAMYYSAQNLTTDASRLRKAMKEYRNFIIHEL